jgi:V/A-type H+-transporting ATPase subunit K
VKTRFIISSILTAVVAMLALMGSVFIWFPDVMAAPESSWTPILSSEVWAWGLMAAALATGLSSLGAAYAVGAVGAAAMGTLTEKPELFGRLLIFVGLAEGIAIYGVIISVLILDKIV